MNVEAYVGLVDCRIHSFYVRIVRILRYRSKAEFVSGIEPHVSGNLKLMVRRRHSYSYVSASEREIRQTVVERLQSGGNLVPLGCRNSGPAHGVCRKVRDERGISYRERSERSEERGCPNDGGFYVFDFHGEGVTEFRAQFIRC